MVQSKDWKIINDNKRDYIKIGQILNAVEIHTSNSLEHELKKLEICYNLKKEGHNFMTEAILKNGSRPDIIVLDVKPPIAYEVMKSESDESIKNKETTYGDIKIIPVRLWVYIFLILKMKNGIARDVITLLRAM